MFINICKTGKKKVKLFSITKIQMNNNNEFNFLKGNVEIHNSTQEFHKKIKNLDSNRETEAIQKLKTFFEENRLPYKIHPGSFCP